MNYRIFPPEELIEGTVELPLSKSVSNRALMINALAGAQAPERYARCADTDVLAEALFGSPQSESVNVGASGTAMRFLTAWFAGCEGRTIVLDGVGRMRRRPVAPLVDALQTLGASVEYLGEEGFVPMRITGCRLHGGDVRIAADVSSQFVSALLFAATKAQSPVRLILDGDLVSADYVALTVSMLQTSGIEVDVSPIEIVVTPGRCTPVESVDDGDWTAASYWYEIAALSAGWLELAGLQPDSVQGDRRVTQYFDALCVGTEWTDEGIAQLIPSPEQAPRLHLALENNPDLAPTLAVSCCMLGVPFTFTGLANLRHKECDRLEALRLELLKLSFILEYDEKGTLMWEGQRAPVRTLPSIDTYADHRMAMAFAPVGIFCPGIEICDVEVVEKSYPGFWDAMRSIGFTVVDSDNVPEELRQIYMES